MRSEYPLIFERSRAGRRAYDLPALDVPSLDGLIPQSMAGVKRLDLPEIAEVDLVRHYTNCRAGISALTTGFTRLVPVL